MLGVHGQTPQISICRSFQLQISSRALQLSSVSTNSSHGFILSALSSSSSPPKTPSQSTATTTSLFQSYGFSDDHIDLIFHKQPRLIDCSPEKIQPKLDCFLSFGFSTAELTNLVSFDPLLLSYSAESRLLYNLNLLEKLLGSKKLVKKSIARSSRVLKLNLERFLMPNVNVLESHGVPPEKIAQALAHYPSVMTGKSGAISGVANELKRLGMDPASRPFIVAIYAKLAIDKEKWDRKLALYRSFGWSDENFLTAFRKHPHCMLTTEWKIKKMMGFFVEKLGWDPLFLSQHPIFIDLSLEKRIAPRCAVLDVLASRGLLEKEAALYRLLLVHESMFKAQFVSKHVESIPLVVEVYQTGEQGDYLALKLWQERSKQKSILAGKLQ